MTSGWSSAPVTYFDIGAGLPGIDGCSVAWGDYDADGDLDLLLTGLSGEGAGVPGSWLYRNDGGDVFTAIASGLPGVYVGSVAWGDYDNDGDLDILLTGMTADGDRIARVYRNDGMGTFADIVAGLPGINYGSGAWGDCDNDGDLDILLTGQTSGGPIARVYRNGDGAFSDIGAGLPGALRSSAAWGDYDNDGDLDILIAGSRIPPYGNPFTHVYRNGGEGSFTDIDAELPGVVRGAVAWGDYDGDGDLDIVLTGDTLIPTEGYSITQVYRNDGGVFTDIAAGLLGVRNSSTEWGDCDNDGRLDLLLTGYFSNDPDLGTGTLSGVKGP